MADSSANLGHVLYSLPPAPVPARAHGLAPIPAHAHAPAPTPTPHGSKEILDQNTIVVVDTDEEVAENAYGDVDDDVIIDCTSIFEDGDEIEIDVEGGDKNATEGDNDDIDDVSGSLMGKTGSCMDDMYKLYCRHARATGFSVRKGSSRNSTTGIDLARFFLCSCAGTKQKKAEVETTTSGKTRKKKLVGITRTNCKALLHVKRNKAGIYEVQKHVMEHKHNLTRPEWGHHHRSERKISEETEKIIEQMISSGMKAAKSYHYLEFIAGGKEHVGHTMIDHLNFVSRLNLKKIESGDAQTLIDILEEESANDPNFFYSVKLDGEARLANVFWRDLSIRDVYGIFGDVVVFDTTYRMNKYDLICAPFVEVNC